MSSYSKIYSGQFNVKNINYANGLGFISKNFKSLNCIDFNKQYETLLLLFLEKDFTNNEILFLRNGILELFSAKLFLDNHTPKDKNYFFNEIHKENEIRYKDDPSKANLLENPDFIAYANQRAAKSVSLENEYYEISKELIKTELLIFKTKIERMGYVVHFKNDDVEIIETYKNEKKNNKIQLDKKEKNTATKINNPFILNASKRGKKVLTKILFEKVALIDVIDFINKNTTLETKELLINEINGTYNLMRNEFMFKVKDEDISKALNVLENSLEYVYMYKGDYERFNFYVRDFGSHKTIYNVWGLPTEYKEDTIKLVHLNNLMINYHDDFFENQVEGFEQIKHLGYIVNNLKEIFIDNNAVSNNVDSKNSSIGISKDKESKMAEKWYALLYWLELLSQNKKPPTTLEGSFVRKEIENIGKNKSGKSGQGFYREFTRMSVDIKNLKSFNNSFGKDWKNIIIELSNNDERIVNYLKNN